MELIFKDLDGDTQTLHAKPSATVGDLKQHIALLFNVSCSQLKLSVQIYETVLLDNDQKTLRDYGLTSGFKVTLLISTTTETFPVTVRTLKGQCKTYIVTDNETVDQLMEKISEKEETPVNQVVLTHNSQRLIPGSKLTDYNIGSRSEIRMKRED